jgi:hypothetical protein
MIAGMQQTPKIWGIGLGRTGTTSLMLALKILYPHRRFAKSFVPMSLGHLDGASDIYVAAVFDVLYARMPESKFIYTTRSIAPWLASQKVHKQRIGGLAVSKDPGESAAHVMMERYVYGSWEFDPAVYRDAYQRHDARVRAFFAERPESLLIYSCCDDDREGWVPLCAFLQCPIPSLPFPHAHRSGAGSAS